MSLKLRIRSVGAVVAGFVFIAVFSIGTDRLVRDTWPALFDATGRTDDPTMLLGTLAYVGVYAVVGCWLTSRLAPSHALRHALVLGLLGLAFNLAGSIAMWNTAPSWYHVVGIATTLPWAWIGGKLGVRQIRREMLAALAV
jgi:hypothetical protein